MSEFYEKIINNVKYNVEKSDSNHSHATVVFGRPGASGEIVIEPFVDGIPVTHIAHFAFSHNTDLKSIILPNSIKYIAEFAFEHSGVRHIDLPKDLISIGPYAFHCCGDLENINFNENIRHIEMFAFNSCHKLERIDIPKSLKFMHLSAINDCKSLKQINIDSPILEIMPGNNGFGFLCSNLTSITITPENPNYKSINGVLYDYRMKELIRVPPRYNKKSFHFPKWVQNAEKYAFSDVKNIEAVFVSQPKVRGLSESGLHTIRLSKMYCEPGSFVEDWAQKNSINTETLNSRMNDFINNLVEEKEKR